MFQVASREYRRLKKSNEHHPGYAMSRAYLETLADLPWNTFSGEVQAPSTPEAPQDVKASSTGRIICARFASSYIMAAHVHQSVAHLAKILLGTCIFD